MRKVVGEAALEHDGEHAHEILRHVTEEKHNEFALSITQRLCPGCAEKFKEGMDRKWWVLHDVVSADVDGNFDLLRVFKLTPLGIAERDKLNLH